MTEEEMIRRLEKACEAEDLFPGVLGNPVTFAARWGLPLSKSYLKHLESRNAAGSHRRTPDGQAGRIPRPKPATKR